MVTTALELEWGSSRKHIVFEVWGGGGGVINGKQCMFGGACFESFRVSLIFRIRAYVYGKNGI